jgi:hypothetical protein
VLRFTLAVLSDQKVGKAELRDLVQRLEQGFPGERHVLEAVVAEQLLRYVASVVAGGWCPADLAELVTRRSARQHLELLAAALHADRRIQERDGAWQVACDAVGPERRLTLGTTSAMASALQVASVLSMAPLLKVPPGGPVAAQSAHPKLAKVRALLAKAESTTFDEEAEALSAKAQELITRYALRRFLDRDQATSGTDHPQVRRLWLDAPYVRAKAALVAAVASANRCRAASADKLGFSVVVGATPDLEAVELLVTSLLVQADIAMVRYARRGRSDGGRTRAFRQSFLFAYADRIGRRLREANDQAVAVSEGDRLLPALLSHEARVTNAFNAMVPHHAGRGPTVTSAEGWSAGTIAADLARLDVHGRLAGSDRQRRAGA